MLVVDVKGPVTGNLKRSVVVGGRSQNVCAQHNMIKDIENCLKKKQKMSTDKPSF